MYKYVHTLTKFNFSQYEISLLRQHIDYYLISLINGLGQSSFGLNTLCRVANDIEKLHKKFLGENKKWFIDSGGYSIIVGDVSPRDMMKFIECYCFYLENFAPTQCDYIFSLDIPILLKYPSYNSVEYISKQNKLSCERSKKILDMKQELYEKFVFIWQFKTLKQYKIWDQLYNNIFSECDKLKHFGVGGQVGLRGITGIDFSPFIASCYKILDIVERKDLADTSLLHLLGIYGLHDRFLIGFYDKLFNQIYLKDNKCKIQLTFDTVNHILTGLYNVRKINSIIFDEDGTLLYNQTHNLIDKLHLIIDDQDTLNNVKSNLEHIIKGENITDTSIIATLNVVKNQYINYIITNIIDKKNIVEMFLEYKNYNKFKNHFISVFYGLEKEYPFIFKNRLNNILINFQYTYAFHDWWVKGRELQMLDKLMLKFIQLINFPTDLSGDFV